MSPISPEVQELLQTGDVIRHRKWIVRASDELLDEYILHISGSEQFHRMALAERERRHFKSLSKPHWLISWTFIFTVGIFIVAVLTLVVGLLSLKEPQMSPIPNGKFSTSMTNSASRPLNLPPTKAATPQTSPPAFYKQPGTNIFETHSNYHAP